MIAFQDATPHQYYGATSYLETLMRLLLKDEPTPKGKESQVKLDQEVQQHRLFHMDANTRIVDDQQCKVLTFLLLIASSNDLISMSSLSFPVGL